MVGTAYSLTLSATGGTPPYNNWVLTSGALPPGLTLDASSGIISGVPSSATGSPFSFSVIVKDTNGTVSPPQSLSITISLPSGLTIITSSPLPAGTVGVPYSQAFAATSGVTPYKSWAITVGSIPPGTSLSTLGGILTGLLSGTPTAAGTFSFTVQVTDNAGTAAAKQFSLTINPSGAVTVLPNGITNAASYAGGGVAPGEMVTIFGSGMGPNTLVGLQVDSNGNFAKTLAGVQVLFDNVPAPLVYAQANQISAVVPYGVSGKTATQVQVVYQGQTSTALKVPVVSAIPGIFTIDYSGKGAGAILNQDGTVNSASNPAAAGSYISVYATGEGQTNPPGVDGTLDGSPAPQPVQKVTAMIGGISATVQYAGGSPGLVAGVLQVNLQVPQALAFGNAVPVVLNIGGATSQTGVTIAVKGSGTGNPLAPALASISPGTGAPGTTIPVTLTGTNFVAGASVSVSNPGVAVSNVNVVNGTQITTVFSIAPSAATGAYNVTVTTAGGTSAAVTFVISASQSLAITSLSTNSPVPLTPLYALTTGLNLNAPMMVEFSSNSGFSFTEQPISVGSDGTVVAATPLYLDPVTHSIGPGTVSVVLTQAGQSTAPMSIAIQDLPSVSSYGTKPGQISHAFLVYEAMLITRRINEFQAYQALPGNKVDTSKAQASLRTLLKAFLQARIDVDYVSLNQDLVIAAGSLSSGFPIQFDRNSLDIMDRIIGLHLTEWASAIASVTTSAQASSPMLVHRPVQRNVTTEAGGQKENAQAASGLASVITAITNGANQISLAKATSDYYANDATAVTKSLAVAGGLSSLYGLITVGASDAAKAAGDEYGALVSSVGLLDNLGMELGDLAFLVSASRHGGDPAVVAEAWNDLQTNAHSATINTINTELSLTAFGTDAGAFGSGVVNVLKSAGSQLALQSAALLTATYDCATASGGGCLSSIDNTALQTGSETTTLFNTDSQGFGIVTGNVQSSNSFGLVADQNEMQVSSNGIVFNSLADESGDYQMFVPLQADTFHYASAELQVVDPTTQNTLNIIDPTGGNVESSEVIDLSGLTTQSPLELALVRVQVNCDDAWDACIQQCYDAWGGGSPFPVLSCYVNQCDKARDACYGAQVSTVGRLTLPGWGRQESFVEVH